MEGKQESKTATLIIQFPSTLEINSSLITYTSTRVNAGAELLFSIFSNDSVTSHGNRTKYSLDFKLKTNAAAEKKENIQLLAASKLVNPSSIFACDETVFWLDRLPD
uniref:Uncharacterized protein n=1 Tax=Romanomermis culicivorax TaxID=13658 RepID=A0A915I4P8_ROMCU